MIAQVILLCFVSLASSSPLYQAPIYLNPSTPIYDAKPQPYAFNYDVKDEYGTTLNRQEQGDEWGNKKGSYGYIDSYGISRQVDYVADDKGYRAVVKTNEPGTDNQNPADVEIQSNAVQYQGSSSYSKPVSAYGISSSSANSRPALSSLSVPQVAPVYEPDVVNSVPVRQVALVYDPAVVNRVPVRQIAPIYNPTAANNVPVRQVYGAPVSTRISPNSYNSKVSQPTVPLY